MRHATMALLICVAALSCQSDAERLPLAPLPQDGTALPYSQVLDRISAQTDEAKSAHFNNHWEGVASASIQIEQSAGFLLRSPDLPIQHRERIQKEAQELNTAIRKLRTAAQTKNQLDSLEALRLIHNRVRDLQDLR